VGLVYGACLLRSMRVQSVHDHQDSTVLSTVFMKSSTSIITPTWNRAQSLARCLQSVSRLTPSPHEHILIDNLSEDDTENVIRNYIKKVDYPVKYLREKDCGMYDAQNKAISMAQGDHLFFLNDDDYFDDNNIISTLESTQIHYDTDLVFGDILFEDPQSGVRNYRRHNQVNKWTLIQKGISQQSILYTRKVLDLVGHFDPQYKIAGDYEWLLRALVQFKCRAAYIQKATAVFQLGGVSNSTLEEAIRREERKKATCQYFSKQDVLAAARYRKFWRKIPFGTSYIDMKYEIRLNIIPVTLDPKPLFAFVSRIFD
jgi:glycosyltransferase involved in cell wall biosynthesis